MSELKNVCVFCGSSIGHKGVYSDAAHRLGMELAHHKIGLVYGGSSTGLMGLIADSALKHGGTVTGIIPEALVKREVQHNGLTELHVVNSMHERKAMMAEKSDAFVALPGGIGTYEELFEIITWAQLAIHRKPIAIVNVENFYTPLLAMLNHGMQEGFIRSLDTTLVRVAESAKDVLSVLQEKRDEEFRPKWMDLSQS